MIYLKKFILIFLSTFIIGFLPSLIFGSSVDGLILPKLYPPKIVFPIVWSILYLLMIIGVYRSTKYEDNNYLIYYLQVFMNSIWTVIFFGLKLRLFAFIWIVLLFIVVLYMTILFYKTDKIAGLIQIPYLIWLVFAGYLNLAIYILN